MTHGRARFSGKDEPLNRFSAGSVLLALAASASMVSCTVGKDGTPGAPGVPCTGCVDASSLSTGAVTGASVDPTTTINAASFTFSSPVTNLFFADPALCQRADGAVAPYQDVQAVHPTGNAFGPSIRVSNTTAGTYGFYCPISLHVPNGAPSLTITGATMAFVDPSTNCLVSAEIRSKLMTTNSFGVAASTLFDGASSSDYAFTASNNATKAFPTFTLSVNPLTLVWVHATIQIQSTVATVEDCRYSGVVLSYDVDRP
jgi:hypothetical protein